GETIDPSYTMSTSGTCSGAIVADTTQTCTVTNDDKPAYLIVIKHVINDNGGTKKAADFTTTISGVTTATPSAPGVEAPGVTNELTTVGSYSVDEGAHVGYTRTLSADCSGTIALGQTKTCTITNDDIPAHLILIKTVINNFGLTAVPSDFTMTINDVTASGGNSFPGSGSGTDKTLTTVGTYSVTESSLPGYTASSSVD